jgi:hypothetical protein
MNCREFIDRLQQDLDVNAPPAGPDVEQHVRDCAACAALHAAARRMVAGLRLAKPESPPADLQLRITSAVRRDIRQRRLARRGLFATALAASLVVAIVGRSYFTNRLQPVSDSTLAQGGGSANPATKTPLDGQPGAPELRSAVVEAGEAVASLTTRTADETVDQTRILFPMVPSPLANLDLVAPEAPTRPLREAGENLTAALSPVATSARRAVDLFLRDVPPVGGPNKRKL